MSNMQNEEKKGFFSQIKTAVAKPSGYPSLSRLGGGRAAGFVFLFTFLYMLVILVIPYIYHDNFSWLPGLCDGVSSGFYHQRRNAAHG